VIFGLFLPIILNCIQICLGLETKYVHHDDDERS